MRPRVKKVNAENQKVTAANIVELSWQRGFRGVTALAKHIDRNPVTVWKAVRWPDQFGPTYQKIEEALNA